MVWTWIEYVDAVASSVEISFIVLPTVILTAPACVTFNENQFLRKHDKCNLTIIYTI